MKDAAEIDGAPTERAATPPRRALVTGGGRGIGLAIATRLYKDGIETIITGRTESELSVAAEPIGGRFVVADFSDRASLKRGIERILSRGPFDILVNNAGVASSAPLSKTTAEAWDLALAVNVTAPFALCRALMPTMAERGYGRVVNIASNAGRTGYAYTSAYCASKHALVGVTRALAAEFARTAVTINAICPGFVETDIVESSIKRIVDKTGRTREQALNELTKMSPQRRLIQPDEVAHLVSALLSPQARGMNGQAIVLDGGQVMT